MGNSSSGAPTDAGQPLWRRSHQSVVERTDLSGAHLMARTSRSQLEGRRLSGAYLHDADLSDADLTGADLSDARGRFESGARMHATDLVVPISAGPTSPTPMSPRSNCKKLLPWKAPPCPAARCMKTGYERNRDNGRAGRRRFQFVYLLLEGLIVRLRPYFARRPGY